MCESNVYLKKGDEEELIMEDVSLIAPLPDGRLQIQNILGEEKEVSATIEVIDLMDHKILLKPVGN